MVDDPRSHLQRALAADLVGPYSLDPTSTEILAHAPLRWYLTGFLAPEGTKPSDAGLEEGDDAGDADDTDDEAANADEAPKIPRRLPSSIGLTVFARAGTPMRTRVTWGEYARHEKEGSKASVWHRSPAGPYEVALETDAGEAGLANHVKVIWRSEPAPKESGLPEGTRVLNVFVVNGRAVEEGEALSANTIFQVQLEVRGALEGRENRRGENSRDHDEAIADLQYRELREWAVGHNVGAEPIREGDEVIGARTCWLPTSEVRRVIPWREKGVTVDMDALAELQSGAQIDAALGQLAGKYEAWIEEQAQRDVGSDARRETLRVLAQNARFASKRIRAGIELLKSDPTSFRAFALANRAMADAARRRMNLTAGERVEWRLFQLAFVLLSIPDIADPSRKTRGDVELIYFPTGGGKTEAYLGLIAFTLVLRRLRGRERSDAGLGVTVLLRYTLRLLTLDQLGRAATLICALEILRKERLKELGDVRFTVGLWVGRSATANTIEEFQDQNTRFKQGGRSPCPLPECPWCHTPFDAASFRTKEKPTPRVLASCENLDCPFSEGRDPLGVPIVFVDEAIYSELPCFVVATVDKLAILPWRGATAKLFGHVHSREGDTFFGVGDDGRGKTKLSEGLMPPELVVQDELHLISGPLGTMVGLYETAILMLCERGELGPKIVASTATVRRAAEQCRALYGRTMRIFPPQGPDENETYFSRVDYDGPGRRYLGVAASGRAAKAVLLRVYVGLLGAAQLLYERDGKDAADAYQTLVGYFNSLRELGGMRRLLEDDVRERSTAAEARRMPADEKPPHRWIRQRPIATEPLELTSRKDTPEIAATKRDLAVPRGQEGSVDVVLASNMISVGIDIDRLGLMVVAGQPKSTSEYIQATSRVGRHRDRPGLVVVAFNVHKPRDRSHYERFATFHESFYRAIEATSVTPFAEPALERGLAGALVTMVRLGDDRTAPPRGVLKIDDVGPLVDRAVAALKARARHVAEHDGADALATDVEHMARATIDVWRKLVVSGAVKRYGRLEKGTETPLLHQALDPHKPKDEQARFVLPTSMRDVEAAVPLWVVSGTLGGGDGE